MARVARRDRYERSVLNSRQIQLLELVYKYRFGTRELLARSLGLKSGSSLHERLEVLVGHEYLGRRQDIRSRAFNKPTAYYVAQRGIKALQALPEHEYIGEPAVRQSYQNKNMVRDEFIAHCLNVYELTLHLQCLHPTLKVFTQRQIAQYSYMPEQLPDAFLSLPTDNPQLPQRFFFDIVRDRLPRRRLDAKLTNYAEFFDDGGWDITGVPVPAILLVCEWGPSERSVRRSVRASLSRLDSDLQVYTTTARAIQDNAGNTAIWTGAQDEDELLELSQIS